MPGSCVAKGCRNKGGHFFPKDKVLEAKWLAALNRTKFKPSKHSKLCSAHFLPSDYVTEGYYSGLQLKQKRLKKNAVPSVFQSNVKPKSPEPPSSADIRAHPQDTKKHIEIQTLHTKTNEIILLLQDPEYGKLSEEDSGPEDVDPPSYDSEVLLDNVAGCDTLNSLKSKSEQNSCSSDSDQSLYEYDVTSKPSLRVVSSKSQGADVDSAEDRVYTSEQRDVIIDKLNSLRTDDAVRKLLGAKLTKSVESYLHANGNFSKLEELLKVQSVGPKTVRTLCDKLLGIEVEKSPRSGSSSPTVGSSTRSRKGKSPAHLVSPPLTDEFCSTVKTLGAVVVDVNFISWALVDSKKKSLIDWMTLPLEAPPSSFRDVVLQATSIEKELPVADLFVLEEPILGSRGGHHLKSHLTCSLATALYNQRESVSDVKTAFMKNRLVERHFNACVGSETVSLQPLIQDLVDQKIVVGRSNLFISQDLLRYYRNLEPVAREQLSRAGLLSITCIDLVLTYRNTLDRRKPAEISA